MTNTDPAQILRGLTEGMVRALTLVDLEGRPDSRSACVDQEGAREARARRVGARQRMVPATHPAWSRSPGARRRSREDRHPMTTEPTSLPTWEQMTELDQAAAMQHVWKRENEGRSYAVENYPAEYVDHPALIALGEDDASDHARDVVGSIHEVYDRLGGDEYERLLNMDIAAEYGRREQDPASRVSAPEET